MTEHKTQIVEWFLQTNLSQSSASSKTSTSARKHQQGIQWRRWSSFAQLGMWQARKELGSHVFACPTLLGPYVRVWPHLQHGSLCDSCRKWGIAFNSMVHTLNRSTHASVQDPCLPVSDNCVPRKADRVWWSLAAEPSHSSSGVIWRTKCSALPELCLNWRRGSRKVVHRSQEECSPVLYGILYYVFKWFESPKGLTLSMSSTTLPICEILILVCYFDSVFI